MLTFNFQNIKPTKDSFMLDAGCGPGRHIFGFMDQFSDVTCVGLDLDFDSLQEGKNNLTLFSSISNKESTFLQGSVYNLPFKDNSFETIICSEVLEHVADVDATLKELTRLIRPGGNLLVSVPSYYPEKICWLLSKEYQKMPGGHVRIFKKSTLQEKVEEKGYKLEMTEKYHALHSPYWWLRCLFWSSQENNFLVNIYKKILEIQILRNPPILRILDNLLNPFLGKSTSFYFKKL
tara:strand:- start:1392 stop:2096 length:705 start_codon:yes stop_codon:yes gene_type:complete